MNLHHTSSLRLPGRRLLFVRALWIAGVVAVLVIFCASIPTYFASLHVLAPQIAPREVRLTQDGLHALHALHLSIDLYAVFSIVLFVLFVLGFVLVGAVLFWRKAADRLALLTSFALITFPIGFISYQLETLPPAWWWSVQVVGFLGATSLSVCFYLFPSGRFVPSWSRWLLIGWVIYEGAERFFPSSPLSPLGHVPVRSLGLFFALLASVVAAQIYRYQRVSTPRERQQTRWVVFGCTVGLLGLIAVVFLSTLFPVFFQPGTLAFFPGYALLLLSMLCIPLSIGIAILRSRLWEIDLIINRTLVYGTLTVLLALIYAGFVIGLGELLRLLTGQLGQSPIVIVVSTLAIAALFQPLRRRMQRAIDRRFYRRKYDAARTLAAFSATLRNEVDLTHLKEQLLAVVQETMQPNHVSLWLREPDRKFPHPK